MNNFDRPVTISIDPASSPVAHEGAVGAILSSAIKKPATLSESTKWTPLVELHRGRFCIRSRNAMNNTMFACRGLAPTSQVRSIPLDRLNGTAANGNALLRDVANSKAAPAGTASER